jgi:membrane-bound ClpP family serine protease
MQLYYAIGLLIAFYFVLIAEFFLPSGGFLAAVAVAILVAAVTIAFSHSTAAGIVVVALVIVTTPLFLIGMLRVWPHTAIGRRMLNRRPGQQADATSSRTTSDGTPIGQLVGHLGTAKTNLLPSGMVVIDGEKIDAISTGMPIDEGTTVIVTNTDAGRVHVRAATDKDRIDQIEPTPQSPPSLEESLESFDIE